MTQKVALLEQCRVLKELVGEAQEKVLYRAIHDPEQVQKCAQTVIATIDSATGKPYPPLLDPVRSNIHIFKPKSES